MARHRGIAPLSRDRQSRMLADTLMPHYFDPTNMIWTCIKRSTASCSARLSYGGKFEMVLPDGFSPVCIHSQVSNRRLRVQGPKCLATTPREYFFDLGCLRCFHLKRASCRFKATSFLFFNHLLFFSLWSRQGSNLQSSECNCGMLRILRCFSIKLRPLFRMDERRFALLPVDSQSSMLLLTPLIPSIHR